jgi:hypothetical protein
MSGGVKSLLVSTALLTTACASEDARLSIRAIADPLAAASKPGNSTIEQARGLLALGSVGLALEAFHKGLREQPDSIEALAGIAACYEQMGRYDLSRTYYEQALAVAPRNAVLLNTFAASLQRQGRVAEASAVRAEAIRADAADAETLAMPAPQPQSVATAQVQPPQPQTVTVAQVQAPQPQTVTVAQMQAPHAQTVTVAQVQAPQPQSVPVAQVQAPQPQRAAVAQEQVPVSSTEWTIEPAPAPAVASSVTVALPPVRDVIAEPVIAAAAPAPIEPPRAAPPASRAADELTARAIRIADAIEPRLERLSPGVVALLTGSGPIWSSEVVAQSRDSVTMRFVRAKAADRPNVRLLNAAREQGLAARTREVLVDRGWRKIAIGDASQVRERSLVLYPASRKRTGQSLAAQFGFNSVVSGSAGEMIVLLGRDAPDVPSLRSRG